MMQIGIDLRPLRSPLTGIGNYQFHLLQALLDRTESLRFQGFCQLGWRPIDRALLEQLIDQSDDEGKWSASPFSSWSRRLGKFAAVYHGFKIWQRAAFSWGAPKKTLKLFHAFSYVPPGRIDVPVIPVVYDMSFLRFPEMHPRRRIQSLRGLIETIREAPVIHTISNFTASEICSLVGVEPSRVAVVYPGVNPLFVQPAAVGAEAELARLNLTPGSYFLVVSTLEPRKNLRTLIAAYSLLPESIKARVPLCIAGAEGWGELDLPKTSASLIRQGYLRFLGFVTNQKLKTLYSNACAFCYPSLYEGFGMPIIEALACGSRVICSDATSMPEAGGTAAQRVSPLCIDSWQLALRRLIEEPDTIDDRRARELHARRFNWQRAAHQTMALYSRV